MNDANPMAIMLAWFGSLTWFGIIFIPRLRDECKPLRRRDFTMAPGNSFDLLRSRIGNVFWKAVSPSLVIVGLGFTLSIFIPIYSLITSRLVHPVLYGIFIGYTLLFFALPVFLGMTLFFTALSCRKNKIPPLWIGPAAGLIGILSPLLFFIHELFFNLFEKIYVKPGFLLVLILFIVAYLIFIIWWIFAFPRRSYEFFVKCYPYGE